MIKEFGFPILARHALSKDQDIELLRSELFSTEQLKRHAITLAGWMYRLSIETLLGLHLEADHLRIAPCVPADWESYKVHYRFRETVYHITIKRVGKKSEQVSGITLDGSVLHDACQDGAGHIPLIDDRMEHQVEVALS